MLGNINPDGKQKQVLALSPKGHNVVLGTAGSGKTTMAILRAIGLSNLPDSPKVLVVTFNQALVKYMSNLSDSDYNNLVVESYHKFARGYLNSLGKMPFNCIADKDEKDKYISDALLEIKAQYPEESTLKRPLNVFIDEINFMQSFGIVDLDNYMNIERIGRASTNIRRDNRKWFFKVYERYLDIRNCNGKLYDWEDIAISVYENLINDNRDRKYTHIIIDEGQDFSPIMLKSLVNAIPVNGSFTFFGDVSQQIYGSRLSWRNAGINVKDNPIWRFDANYRNPASVISFAKDITDMNIWQKDADMILPAKSIAEGPKPVLIHFSDSNKEVKWIIERIALDKGALSNVIIFRNRELLNNFANELKSNNIKHTIINHENTAYAGIKGIYLSTFHSAKGLEFDNVYIPMLSNNIIPDKEYICNCGSEEQGLFDELKLLYVAVTRSRYGLFMSYYGDLSTLFPSNSNNCVYYEENEL